MAMDPRTGELDNFQAAMAVRRTRAFYVLLKMKEQLDARNGVTVGIHAKRGVIEFFTEQEVTAPAWWGFKKEKRIQRSPQEDWHPFPQDPYTRKGVIWSDWMQREVNRFLNKEAAESECVFKDLESLMAFIEIICPVEGRALTRNMLLARCETPSSEVNIFPAL